MNDRKKKIIGAAAAFLGCLVLVFVLVAVLNREQPENPASAGSGEPTSAPTAGPTETPSPTPTQTPLDVARANPLKIQGYEYFDGGEAINKGGDVFCKAYIPADSRIDGEYLYNIRLLPFGDDLFWSYIAAPVPQFLDGAGDGEREISFFGGSISKEDNGVRKREYALETTELEAYDGLLTAWTRNENDYIRTTYDGKMTQTGELVLTDAESVCCSEDGSRVYLLRDRKIYACGADGEERGIVPEQTFFFQMLHGVITDETGVDHLFTEGQAGDGNSYCVILNANSGKAEYLSNMSDSYIRAENHTYVETVSGDENGFARWIIGRNGACYDYWWRDSQEYPDLYLPDEDRLLFACFDGAEVRLYLYSYENAEFLGSTSFSLAAAGQSSSEASESGAYMVSAAALPGEQGVLMQLTDDFGNIFFCVWEPENASGPESKMLMEEHRMGSRPSPEIVDIVDWEQYTPSEVRPELAPLRERADELEERFGVAIRIGEECANVLGGYAITPLTDYAKVKEALDVLETELSKYPDRFFTQIKTEELTGNAFYLAGMLLGVEDGSLGTAGGFQCEYDGKWLIVIDCEVPYSMQSTIHHELFHSIEDYMSFASDTEGGLYPDEEEWQALNPPLEKYGDCYTYSYDEFGYEENYGLLYDTQFYAGEDVSGAYFVDSYCMTFPWEDRARLFESVMCDFYSVDFEAAPHLKAKLDYMADCIRKTFDTTGWTEVPWER